VFISLSLTRRFVLSERENCRTLVATYPIRVRVSLPQFFDFLEPSKLRIKPSSKIFENCWVRVQLASEAFIYPPTLNPLLCGLKSVGNSITEIRLALGSCLPCILLF
jgi:hypothetical protein